MMFVGAREAFLRKLGCLHTKKAGWEGAGCQFTRPSAPIQWGDVTAYACGLQDEDVEEDDAPGADGESNEELLERIMKEHAAKTEAEEGEKDEL